MIISFAVKLYRYEIGNLRLIQKHANHALNETLSCIAMELLSRFPSKYAGALPEVYTEKNSNNNSIVVEMNRKKIFCLSSGWRGRQDYCWQADGRYST